MELEAGSGKAARRTGRLNNDRGPGRMLTFCAAYKRPKPPTARGTLMPTHRLKKHLPRADRIR